MSEDDPFDVAKLRMPAAETWAVVPKKVARRRERFVVVSGVWKERLLKAKHISTYRLALHILMRNFETGGTPFNLSNGAMAMEKISPREKWRAIAELEALGLATIERRKRRSPVVTAIHLSWDTTA